MTDRESLESSFVPPVLCIETVQPHRIPVSPRRIRLSGSLDDDFYPFFARTFGDRLMPSVEGPIVANFFPSPTHDLLIHKDFVRGRDRLIRDKSCLNFSIVTEGNLSLSVR